MRAKRRCRVAVGRHQQVEGVTGYDNGARALGALESVRELNRRGCGCLGSLRVEKKVAHDDHSPAEGDRQTGDRHELGHVPFIVAVSHAIGR